MADRTSQGATSATGGSAGAGRLVALLRGVNVGGRNRIAMADLRRIVEDLGFSDVRTHLQSGNVVFAPGGATAGLDVDAAGVDVAMAGVDVAMAGVDVARASVDVDAAARSIEAALREELGLAAPVLARTAEDLRCIVAARPLADIATDPSRLRSARASVPAQPVCDDRRLPAFGGRPARWRDHGVT